jgi:hypothetical protein
MSVYSVRVCCVDVIQCMPGVAVAVAVTVILILVVSLRWFGVRRPFCRHESRM